jgi:type III secretion protein X
MADLRLDSSLAFDRGIERVIHEHDEPALLPESPNLAPSELARAAQLDRLLALPNLDDYLQGALQPSLGNKDLLQPGKFRDALGGCARMLREAAQADPAQARPLERAARVLAEEGDLRDLLQMYRTMLLQG